MRYSKDLRPRVVKYVRQGGSKVSAAERFGVSRQVVYNWLARGDDYSPSKPGPRQTHKLNWEALRKGIEEQPDRIVTEWAALFGVGTTAIHYALGRMRLSRKKNLAL